MKLQRLRNKNFVFVGAASVFKMIISFSLKFFETDTSKSKNV